MKDMTGAQKVLAILVSVLLLSLAYSFGKGQGKNEILKSENVNAVQIGIVRAHDCAYWVHDAWMNITDPGYANYSPNEIPEMHGDFEDDLLDDALYSSQTGYEEYTSADPEVYIDDRCEAHYRF